MTTNQLKAGMLVEITQQIAKAQETWTTKVKGTVIKVEQEKTGSWYAHSKDDKLWLDRLTLRLDDGEITELILDGNTHVEIIDESGLCDAT